MCVRVYVSYACFCVHTVHVVVCTLHTRICTQYLCLCSCMYFTCVLCVGSVHLCVLVLLQYDEDAECRKVVATKKRKLNAMEEQWRVRCVHN